MLVIYGVAFIESEKMSAATSHEWAGSEVLRKWKLISHWLLRLGLIPSFPSSPWNAAGYQLT
jgi:hypothetical protein